MGRCRVNSVAIKEVVGHHSHSTEPFVFGKHVGRDLGNLVLLHPPEEERKKMEKNKERSN
jgi:hypothetical protein